MLVRRPRFKFLDPSLHPVKGLDLDCLDCLAGKYKISGNSSLFFFYPYIFIYFYACPAEIIDGHFYFD